MSVQSTSATVPQLAPRPTSKRPKPQTRPDDDKKFWLTERLHQIMEWVRSEEADALKKRQADRAKRSRRKAQGKRERLGYVDRVLSASDDMEVIVWRGLRLLILLNLCVAATSIIALVVVLFFAGQAFGAGRVSVVAGGALSTVSAAGVLAWRLVRRRGKSRTAK